MNTIWKFLLLGVCLYAGLTALIYLRQSSLNDGKRYGIHHASALRFLR